MREVTTARQGKAAMSTAIRRILPIAAATLILSLSAPALSDEIFAKDGIAINGYDPVGYFTDGKPVKGSKAFSFDYGGATFYFASAAHRDAFARDPARYTPQFGGYCAYGTAEGHKAPTEPQAFTVVNGKLYLNYNDRVAGKWRKDTQHYIDKANANWSSVKEQPAP
jgi:YHS domain-containing protein